MSVRLVWVTPDAEKVIQYCARVSNPANQDSNNIGLLRYCAKHGHWSVFEMASMCVEINTSRAIARQILRHRSFSFQEFSQRYASVDQLSSTMVPAEARSQDLKNRQNSTADMSAADQIWFESAQERVYKEANDVYKTALKIGVAKECARAVLPEGLTPSRMYMSGTIRSWMHYLQLRCGNGTQKEHVDIANEIKGVLHLCLTNVHDAIFKEDQ